MKSKKITFFVLLSVLFLSCSQYKIVELPLTPQKGYGPFCSVLMTLPPYWGNEISHFPEGLTDMKHGDIDANSCQTIYQNYLLGTITKEDLQAHLTFDTLNLSKTPIKTKIAFAYGKDSDGVLKIAVDANNNLDLSDDELFIPIEMNSYDELKKDSIAQVHAVNVSLETFVHDKIVPVTVPLLIEYYSPLNLFASSFSQYMTTQYKGKKIAVSSFTCLSYNDIELAFMPKDWRNREKLEKKDIYRKNEYIEIKEKKYKVLGVNTNKNTLVLEKINLPKTQLFSTQIGYRAYPFEGEDLTTNSNISLENFKGKFVLLDFWAEWCGPCIKEFPHLKELYAKTDRAKFEIIGIAGSSSSDGIKKLIDKHELPWIQILSDDTNKIVETYGVMSFPTTILIDTEGVIIAKNLRGDELVEQVLSLIEE